MLRKRKLYSIIRFYSLCGISYQVVLLAVWFPVLLEELPCDLLLANEALEARLVVHLAKGSATVLVDGLATGAAVACNFDLMNCYAFPHSFLKELLSFLTDI